MEYEKLLPYLVSVLALAFSIYSYWRNRRDKTNQQIIDESIELEKTYLAENSRLREEMKLEIKDLKTEIKDLKKELKETEIKLDATTSDLNDLTVEFNKVIDERDRLREENERLKKKQ